MADRGAGPATGPAHWVADVVLRDGGTAHLRPIRPQDGPALRAFHARLSEQTVYLRYFAPHPQLSDADLVHLTVLDMVDRVALVATVGAEIIGVVRYDRVGTTDAEVAFTVRDDHQGRGLGSVLLEHIAAAARERGVTRFVAEVLPSNARMLAVFREAGYSPRTSREEGYLALEFPLAPTPASREVMEAREHAAEAASVARLLAPSSVAVVGASDRPGSVGGTVLAHLRAGGYAGPVYPVHPRAATVAGLAAWPSVSAIHQPVDLAVVAVPAAGVPAVVADCGDAGVHALVVLSAGYAETGPDGRERQAALVAAVRASGMRLVGPNCLGVMNTAVALNASLAPQLPPVGRVGFFSQSGPMGVVLLTELARRGLGLSTFVSAGNRADVSGNDLLQYWEDDPGTDVALLYLESIGNPRKFHRIARRTSRTKPVVAVKSGRASQGVPLGHTVRRTRLPPGAVESLFGQSGVVSTPTLGAMFDVATLLTRAPLPAGRRVAALANSDAMAVLAADAIASAGLDAAGDPVRLPPGVHGVELAAVLAGIADDPAVDAVVLGYVAPGGGAGADLLAALARAGARAATPILATVLGVPDAEQVLGAGSPVDGPGRVAAFPTLEEAVAALAAVVGYAQWRAQPPGEPLALPGVDEAAARAQVAAWLDELPGGGPLDAGQIGQLLACYGVHLWPALAAADVVAAQAAAATLGYPVVVKAAGGALRHREELGGVRRGLDSAAAVAAAVTALAPVVGEAGLVVQAMAPPGVACVAGSAEDPLFGPVVSFGLGGAVAELVRDRGYAIPPLTDADAAALVSRPAAAALLHGYRGAPGVDTAALADLVARLGRLAVDLPEVASLELSPVLASPGGVAVLGAQGWLAPAGTRTDAPARRLGWAAAP